MRGLLIQQPVINYGPRLVFEANKCTNANIFSSSTLPLDNLRVYINGGLTDQSANSLTCNVGDVVIIDCGDSIFPTFTNTNSCIKSILEPLPTLYGNDQTPIKSISFMNTALENVCEYLFINNPQLTTLNGAFRATRVASIPNNLLYGLSNLTSAEIIFEWTGIKQIPNDLFAYSPKLYNLRAAFADCRNLVSVPQGLFDAQINVSNLRVHWLFNNCYALQEVPITLFENHTGIEFLAGMFSSCTNLIPIVRIGTTRTVNSADSFAAGCKDKGKVYVRQGTDAYNKFVASTNANVIVLTY